GISAPYEAPDAPDLIVDTMADDVERCARNIVEYVERHFSLATGKRSGRRPPKGSGPRAAR
ncbi:MAG: hypothetical protein IH906_07475, partial [Proteobacteria bacterium]|nr:hypothetical protein [Pseudomonadota bacterium]